MPNQGQGSSGSQTNQQQQQASSNMFGGQAAQTNGHFGGQSNAIPQSGGLFGQKPAQQSGGSLFGSTNTQQPQAQVGGGLFSSSGLGQNAPVQQSQGQGLFGSLNNQSKTSLFSTQQPNQGQAQQRPAFLPQPSSFNQSQQPAKSLFSSSIGQYTQQQQNIPGVRVDLSQLRPTTRFNDLYEDVQKIIEAVDNFVLKQMQFQEQCEQAMPKIESAFSYMPDDVQYCSRKLDTMQQALENDAEAIDHAKVLVKQDVKDARLSFKTIQNLRMPQQFHHSGLWNAPAATQTAGPSLSDEDETDEEHGSNIVSYFSKRADDMSKTLQSYQKNISDVESYLKGVEGNTIQQLQRVQFTRGRDGGERSADDQVRELAAVLREFENGILSVAGKVGAVREEVQTGMLEDGGSRNRRFGTY
ncbi:hypothetical protein MMC09_000592 [Bachmanniomyces sp. S44760]|nr:hypothetical protein [Bachmanniomyces sp. S44760]